LTIAGNSGVPLRYVFPDHIPGNSNALSYGTSGTVPSGAALSSAGVFTWSSPVQGSHSFTVTSRIGNTISATYNLTLSIGGALQGASIDTVDLNGAAGVPLVQTIRITDNDANVTRISLSIRGAPLGMRFYGAAQGLRVLWGNPVAGTYALNITATDITPDHGNVSNSATVRVVIP
jgi:hypothetical protein